MRVITIADDDSLVGKMDGESADVLISLGDIWDSTIEKAQAAYGCTTVFAVKGNHDSAAPFPSSVTDLHFNVTRHEGIRFGGFSGSWKYKPRGHHMFEQFEVTKALRSFPAVDVFVAHNSPRDFTSVIPTSIRDLRRSQITLIAFSHAIFFMDINT